MRALREALQGSILAVPVPSIPCVPARAVLLAPVGREAVLDSLHGQALVDLALVALAARRVLVALRQPAKHRVRSVPLQEAAAVVRSTPRRRKAR